MGFYFRTGVILISALFSFFQINAQDVTGQWNGLLETNNTKYRVVFNIKASEIGYSSTMDSPDQGIVGIIVNTTSFKDSILKLSIDKANVTYEGIFRVNDSIKGSFKQGKHEIPLNLTRQKKTLKMVNERPQEPKEPFSYVSEEVTFRNEKAKINLAGTLTIPNKKGPFSVVILLSGSGPQNRNEEAFGHKPFLVLSDYLTRNGIAVLRYDDRGTAQSEGNYKSARLQDFASDAIAAIDYLKTRDEIDTNKIGIIGHSEGGTIAPMIAKKTKDLDFIISLAGTVLRGDAILLLQQRLGGLEAGASEEILEKSKNVSSGAYNLILKYKNKEKLKRKLTLYLEDVLKENPSGNNKTDQEFIEKQITKLTSPWMTSFVRYNPIRDISKLKIPILALMGDKDTQVPSIENIEALSLIGNSKSKIIEFEGVNHMFQECETGSPNEYSKIMQTLSPEVLSVILNYIKKVIG